MSDPETSRPEDIAEAFESITSAVRLRLRRNRRIRRNLPGGGRLRIDRQLPFLCVYRSPPHAMDAGTEKLVTTEAAYLFASGEATSHEGIVRLCHCVGEIVQEHFGVFLLIEIWADPELNIAPEGEPAFRIITEETETLPGAIDGMEAGLRNIHLQNYKSHVEVTRAADVAPPGLKPLLPANCPAEGGCFQIGLAVRPVYRDPESGVLFPLVLQSLRRQLARVLRKTIFAFSGLGDADPDLHYESLGPTSLVKASRLVDQQLCEVSDSFDFLLQVTPVNAQAAWQEFSASRFESEPALYYRPLPYHPSELKRRLFEIPLERIEDVTLAHLFSEKQEELDRQITAIKGIGTPAFLYDSMQLYGAADDELLQLAGEILSRYGPQPCSPENGFVDAERIAAAAREQIDYYHLRLPDFNATVEIVDHIASGMLVSKHRLYVAEQAALRSERVTPLLHHEIGTHLLTYFNGRQQPFRQLYAGLAGCEALQEGLAVLAEYFGGGLTRGRMRTLAGRVVAVRMLTESASFVETFRRLHGEHGFSPRTAFNITLRVYRAGGLTKDVVYLRGLRDLLAFIRRGHDVEPLYVGKIALAHVPFIQELRRRKIIQPPALLPQFWKSDFHARLDDCRKLEVLDLVEGGR